MSTSELTILIPEGMVERLDKALAALAPAHYALSRSRIQELIQSGAVFQGGEAISSPKTKTRGGERILIQLPPVAASDVEPENIPLDIVYEDNDLIVVNKPSGMVVHPAPTIMTGTLVHALLYHAGDSLSGIGGVERPGIVHRIDKDTSGLLVVAKNDRAHEGLSQQFRVHSILRRYTAFTYGNLQVNEPRVSGLEGLKREGGGYRIDLPIGRHKTDRLRQAIRNDGRHAITHVKIMGHDEAQVITKVECELETGRTHQIRVHLNHIGHALLGDPIYGKGARQLPKSTPSELRDLVATLHGQALHASVLGFEHPVTGEELFFETPLPQEMQELDQYIQD